MQKYYPTIIQNSVVYFLYTIDFFNHGRREPRQSHQYSAQASSEMINDSSFLREIKDLL